MASTLPITVRRDIIPDHAVYYVEETGEWLHCTSAPFMEITHGQLAELLNAAYYAGWDAKTREVERP